MIGSFRGSLMVAGTLLLAAASGCQSGPAPRDHHYRLELPTPAALPSPALPGTLEVDRLRVEAVSQGRRIVFREDDHPSEVRQHRYHQWSDTPSVMIQDQMVQYLRAAGVAEAVVRPAVRVNPDYRLAGRIGRLEQSIGSGDQRVTVEIELALVHDDGNELLLLETYREERSAAGRDVSSGVEAMADALGTILDRFVADVGSHVR